jgi:hydroxymethylglutaryl-CoA lyase
MFMDCSLIQQYTIREDMPMAHAPDVHICEVAPRDGLQNLDAFVPTEAKCALIDAIVAAGAGEIDTGSFVPPKIVPQFADADTVMAHALTHEATTIGAPGAELQRR